MLKIHDWHILLGTDVGKFCLFGLLPLPLYSIFCGFSDIFKNLLCLEVDVQQFEAFYQPMVEILCAYEEKMIAINHLMVVHLLLELYKCVQRLGPTFYYWMYMFGTL